MAFGRHPSQRHALRGDVAGFAKRAGQRKTIPPRRNLTTLNAAPNTPRSKLKPYITVPATLLVAGGIGYVTYENYQPFRHTVLAVVRCSRVAGTEGTLEHQDVVLTRGLQRLLY